MVQAVRLNDLHVRMLVTRTSEGIFLFMRVNKKPQTAAISDSRQFASGSGNELSLIQQGENLLYDARLLHKDLRVKTQFNDWIKRRIEKYGFELNVDFFVTQNRVAKTMRNDYLLTLDTAKEFSMLEENEIGRATRKRFIAKEKELRAISHLPKEAGLFKGIKSKTINNRRLYPYVQVLARCGYNPKNNSSSRKAKYWMHFVKEGKISYVTEEFALHLYKQRQVYNNRAAMQAMQPVLALDFYPTQNKGGAV